MDYDYTSHGPCHELFFKGLIVLIKKKIINFFKVLPALGNTDFFKKKKL